MKFKIDDKVQTEGGYGIIEAIFDQAGQTIYKVRMSGDFTLLLKDYQMKAV